MPTRKPPFVLKDKHEVRSAGAELDVDWTLCPEDKAMEFRLREVRNKLLKERLLAGDTVCVTQKLRVVAMATREQRGHDNLSPRKINR